jgi:autotransporter-associated beta strand protein
MKTKRLGQFLLGTTSVQSPSARKANFFQSPITLLKPSVIAAFVAGPLISLPALAVDYTWTGTTGNWSATTWSPGPITGPITAGNSAIINSGTVSVNVAGLNLDLTTLGSGARLNTFNFNGVNTYGTFNLDMKGSTFSGSGSFSTFGSGILKSVIASGSAASTISAVSSGAFNLTGTGAGATTFNVGDVASGVDLTVSAPLWNTSGGTSDLTKTGAGELALTAANTYSGVTNVNAGTVSFSTATAFGTAAGNTIVASGATVYKGGGAFTVTEPFNINGTGVGGIGAIRIGGGGSPIFSGAVTLAGNASIGSDGGASPTMSGGIVTGGNTLTLAPTGPAFTISTAAITGTGGLIVNSGTVSLDVASSYSGGTTLSGGTLNIGVAISGSTSAIGSTSGALTVNGGTLNMASRNVTVGNLTGSGGIISGSSGTRTLTIGQGNGTGGNFLGQINTGSGGTTALSKVGTGAITLSGTNNYTGATIVSGGKLSIGSTGTITNTSGVTIGTASTAATTEFNYNSSTALSPAVSFASLSTGGTLSGSGTISQPVTITSGNTLAPGSSIESLGTGALSFASNSTYAYELQTNLFGSSPTSAGDLTYTASTLEITPGAILTLSDLAASTKLLDGSKLSLISYNGGWSNTELFTYLGSPLADDSTFTLGLNDWRFDYNDTLEGVNFATDSPNGQSYVTITVVPEPGAALLGSLGLLAILRRRRA